MSMGNWFIVIGKVGGFRRPVKLQLAGAGMAMAIRLKTHASRLRCKHDRDIVVIGNGPDFDFGVQGFPGVACALY